MITTLLALTVLAAEPAESPNQLSAYAHSGLTLFISNVRTQGGVGGGLGLRDTLLERWIFEADVDGLAALGAALSVRVGAGIQRRGLWTPAALIHLTGLFGDRLSFPTPQMPAAGTGPGLAVGLTLAPLRFSLERVHVSCLEVTAGLGPDGGGLGRLYGLTLLEVAAAL